MAQTRGRRPKGSYKLKTQVLSTRIRADTREALEGAAKQRGHSLSQEIEHRLRRSFDEDRKFEEFFGSRENFAVVRLIASIMTSHADPNDWKTNAEICETMIAAIALVLRLLNTSEEMEKAGRDRLFNRVQMAAFVTARFVAANVVDAVDAVPLNTDDPAPMIKTDLSPSAVERLQRLADAAPEFVPHERSAEEPS